MMVSRHGRFAMLLDSGCVSPIYASSRAKALALCERWREARRRALAEESIVVPRRVLGFVSFRKSAADRSAVRLGHKGGLARAAKLTPARRQEIARRAADVRWTRDRDGTAIAAANGDLPVPKDCQARASEGGIAQ